jgi:hypothetical protein
VSLLVTIFNGILTLFKVDKKYFFLNTTLERLRSEGWQYFSLTGRYSGQLLKSEKPTHSNQFKYFTHYVEKIKMKQVEEEYYKAEEKVAHNPNSTTTGTNQNIQELYPPSPDQPLNTMIANIPEPVKEAVKSLIKSHSTIYERGEYKDRRNTIYGRDTFTPRDKPQESVIVIPQNTVINATPSLNSIGETAVPSVTTVETAETTEEQIDTPKDMTL